MLQIGYYKNFKGDQPTLLFAGSASDVLKLMVFFRDWDGEKTDLLKYFENGSIIEVNKIQNIIIERGVHGRTNVTSDDFSLTWSITKKDQDRIMGLLEGLVESNKPSHQYLNDGLSNIQIICSKDEYPN
ncbi:MAG TPA: hypothetical protein VFK12_09035 [Gammaproteobacteria bacterium]|jgi:hypothetical protein|nr:hypothetical protein [Gammaproteobacteria bacterium]